MKSGSLLLVMALVFAGSALAEQPKQTQEPAACPVGTDARTDQAKGKTQPKVKPGTFEDVVQGDVSRAKEAAASRAKAEESAPVWESDEGEKAEAEGDKDKKAEAEGEKGR